MGRLEDEIAAAARARGFTLVGFAPLRRLPRQEFYSRWLGQGRHGEMAYLARDPERRLDPRRLDPRLRSVISLGFPYQAPAPSRLDWRREMRGRIASYALADDYHDRVMEQARAVAAELQRMRPGALTRLYVDTGPVFERDWAREAGLGWFGKNTNLLNRSHGSYFFLAEIFTDLETSAAPAAYGDFCGTCRRCLELCPTGALEGGYVMESRRCISYLTIELRGPIAPQLRPHLGNWIFGCDICQEVCPWNEPGRTQPSELEPYLPDLLMLDEEGFRGRFRNSAIKRAKRRGLLRNVAVALGNTGNPDAVAVLAEAMRREGEPLVRAHVAWALGRLGGRQAHRALRDAAAVEADAAVKMEIAAALSMRVP
jgi:epoxyqueuosine reductase